MSVEAKFSFLTAGPSLTFKLPDDFDVLPDLSSPVTIGDDQGARSFDFVTHSRDQGIQEPHRVLGTLAGRDGRKIELFERIDPPQQWYLRWDLVAGALYTHLREEDGVERAETIAASLGIVENGGAPFLLPDRPLGRGVSSTPGYQEIAIFKSTVRAWVVELQRPGYVSQGKIMRLPNNEQAIHRAGARGQVEVTVLSEGDAEGGRALANDVIASLA
jgi:hypothetical protein